MIYRNNTTYIYNVYTQSYVANWDTHPSKPLPPLACQGTSPWAPFLFAVTPLRPPRLWGLLFHFLRDPLGKGEQFCPDLRMNTTKDTTKVPHSHGSHICMCCNGHAKPQQPTNVMAEMKHIGFKVPWCSSQTLSRRTDSLRVELMTNNYISPCIHVCMEVRVPKKRKTHHNMDNCIDIPKHICAHLLH